MAFTAFRTWTVGEVVTAAQLNEQLRDNGNFFNSPPACRVYRTTTLSLSDNTDTVVGMDAESFDYSTAFHDNVTNNSRITIPSGLGGRYLCMAQANFAANATNRRVTNLRKSGASAVSLTVLPGIGGSPNRHLTATVADLAAADYLELVVNQNSGGSLNLNGGENESWMLVQRLSA
jgi:hypothetical protein